MTDVLHDPPCDLGKMSALKQQLKVTLTTALHEGGWSGIVMAARDNPNEELEEHLWKLVVKSRGSCPLANTCRDMEHKVDDFQDELLAADRRQSRLQEQLKALRAKLCGAEVAKSGAGREIKDFTQRTPCATARSCHSHTKSKLRWAEVEVLRKPYKYINGRALKPLPNPDTLMTIYDMYSPRYLQKR